MKRNKNSYVIRIIYTSKQFFIGLIAFVILFCYLYRDPDPIDNLASTASSHTKVKGAKHFKKSHRRPLPLDQEEKEEPTLEPPLEPIFDATTQAKNIMKTIHELFQLGVNNPKALIKLLDTEDPLETSSGPDEFICPTSTVSRIDFPDIVDHSRTAHFKDSVKSTWVFYQHLRKAGGTSFCDLAKSNMPQKAIPPYYCMPDSKGKTTYDRHPSFGKSTHCKANTVLTHTHTLLVTLRHHSTNFTTLTVLISPH